MLQQNIPREKVFIVEDMQHNNSTFNCCKIKRYEEIKAEVMILFDESTDNDTQYTSIFGFYCDIYTSFVDSIHGKGEKKSFWSRVSGASSNNYLVWFLFLPRCVERQESHYGNEVQHYNEIAAVFSTYYKQYE